LRVPGIEAHFNYRPDASKNTTCFCSVFQGFSKAKFSFGGSILSSSQFLILPQLPQKMKLTSKVVKIEQKKLSRYLRSKSLKLPVKWSKVSDKQSINKVNP
jgi:hypothetical protein